jgi:hypothetical protein
MNRLALVWSFDLAAPPFPVSAAGTMHDVAGQARLHNLNAVVNNELQH